jgi:hypothetical protein
MPFYERSFGNAMAGVKSRRRQKRALLSLADSILNTVTYGRFSPLEDRTYISMMHDQLELVIRGLAEHYPDILRDNPREHRDG